MLRAMLARRARVRAVKALVRACDCFSTTQRKAMIDAILTMVDDMELSLRGLPPRQQAMLATWVAIVCLGRGGSSYADAVIRHFAVKHGEPADPKAITEMGRHFAVRGWNHRPEALVNTGTWRTGGV